MASIKSLALRGWHQVYPYFSFLETGKLQEALTCIICQIARSNISSEEEDR